MLAYVCTRSFGSVPAARPLQNGQCSAATAAGSAALHNAAEGGKASSEVRNMLGLIICILFLST